MYIAPRLNIQATPEEDLRAAFDLMEGEGFYDSSSSDQESRNSIASTRKTLVDQQKEYADFWMHQGEFADDTPEDQEVFKRLYDWNKTIPASIYGRNGWHRYFVRVDGTLVFSGGHSFKSIGHAARDAEDLGFDVFD